MLKTLKRKIEDNDNKLKFSEGEMERLKILCEEEIIEKEKNEKKKRADIDISKFTFKKEVDCTNHKENPSLISKNGRTSIGSAPTIQHSNR